MRSQRCRACGRLFTVPLDLPAPVIPHPALMATAQLRLLLRESAATCPRCDGASDDQRQRRAIGGRRVRRLRWRLPARRGRAAAADALAREVAPDAEPA